MAKHQPPRHLSLPARRLFASVVELYELEAHDLAIFVKSLEAWDRAEQARELVAAEGLLITSRLGERKAHPAVMIERDSRTAFLSGMRQLGLDDAEPSPTARTAAARE